MRQYPLSCFIYINTDQYTYMCICVHTCVYVYIHTCIYYRHSKTKDSQHIVSLATDQILKIESTFCNSYISSVVIDHESLQSRSGVVMGNSVELFQRR